MMSGKSRKKLTYPISGGGDVVVVDDDDFDSRRWLDLVLGDFES